jgi:hypothetical protein
MTQIGSSDPQKSLTSEGAKATGQSRTVVSMRGPPAAVSPGSNRCVLRMGSEGESTRERGGVMQCILIPLVVIIMSGTNRLTDREPIRTTH